MNKLSIELRLKIINYLPYDQLIELRLINEEWRSIFDNYLKVYNLAISDFKINYHYFFGDHKLIDCFFIKDSGCNLSKLNLDQFYFDSIKCLLISIDSNSFKCDNLLNQIKYLKNLKFLELEQIEINYNCEIESLSLNHMKISIGYHVEKLILINTPNLINLKLDFYVENRLEFKHPESVKNLEILEYTDKILEFINVEYISIYNEINSKFTISKFKKLNQLLLFGYEDVVNDLINQKEQLKEKKLKIFYQYVKIDNQNELRKLEKFKNFNKSKLKEDNFYFLIKYQFKLPSKLTFIKSINYDCLDYSNQEELFQFLDKIELSKLIVNKELNDENKFKNLLKRSKKLTYFKLKNTKLISSILLNKLPNLLPKLNDLYFDEIDIKTDNDMLLKFVNLARLTINYTTMPFELIDKLFDETNIYEINCSTDCYDLTVIHFNGFFYENGRYKDGGEFDSFKELYDYVNTHPEYIDGYIEYVVYGCKT